MPKLGHKSKLHARRIARSNPTARRPDALVRGRHLAQRRTKTITARLTQRDFDDFAALCDLETINRCRLLERWVLLANATGTLDHTKWPRTVTNFQRRLEAEHEAMRLVKEADEQAKKREDAMHDD